LDAGNDERLGRWPKSLREIMKEKESNERA
jgi:hypothetical protein